MTKVGSMSGHVRVKQERKVYVAKMRDQGECTGWVEKAF